MTKVLVWWRMHQRANQSLHARFPDNRTGKIAVFGVSNDLRTRKVSIFRAQLALFPVIHNRVFFLLKQRIDQGYLTAQCSYEISAARGIGTGGLTALFRDVGYAKAAPVFAGSFY